MDFCLCSFSTVCRAQTDLGATVNSETGDVNTGFSVRGEATVVTGSADIGVHVYGYGLKVGVEGSALAAGVKVQLDLET